MDVSNRGKSLKGKISFDELLEGLNGIFQGERVNVEEVQDLLNSYHSDPSDWNKYAVFDDHRYTRNLVDEGNGKYNVMILCWGEGMGSSIHDHSNSHCFVKMLDGQLAETLFEWPEAGKEEVLKNKSRTTVYRDDVTYINDSLGLHRMENTSHTDKAVSLHVYVPPFSNCLTFDERTGHKRTCKVTFWSIAGERTKSASIPVPDNKPKPVESNESLN